MSGGRGGILGHLAVAVQGRVPRWPTEPPDAGTARGKMAMEWSAAWGGHVRHTW